jgi:hypothetical protein
MPALYNRAVPGFRPAEAIMKKSYVRKIATVSKFGVWLVDGETIRTSIDEEFTNFGQHFRFRFIPRNEFWIDHLHAPGEEHFFIDHLLIENRLMAAGMGYDQALARADRAELKERHKVDYIRKGIDPGRPKSAYIRKIHKRLLKTYSDGLSVWIVNGELVRDLFFIDYTEGGHDKVYRFIPQAEVWLDDDLRPRERRYVLLHEVHERRLMAGGMDYIHAHRSSSHIEYACRHRPYRLKPALAEEMALNRNLEARRA